MPDYIPLKPSVYVVLGEDFIGAIRSTDLEKYATMWEQKERMLNELDS